MKNSIFRLFDDIKIESRLFDCIWPMTIQAKAIQIDTNHNENDTTV